MTSCYAMHEWVSAYRTPKSVRRRSSRVDFRLRNPSSADVVLVIKALFSIFDPHNRVETNMYFVFTHVFVLALRYLHFFSVAKLYFRLHKIFSICLSTFLTHILLFKRFVRKTPNEPCVINMLNLKYDSNTTKCMSGDSETKPE